MWPWHKAEALTFTTQQYSFTPDPVNVDVCAKALLDFYSETQGFLKSIEEFPTPYYELAKAINWTPNLK